MMTASPNEFKKCPRVAFVPVGSICRNLAREHDVPISPPRQLLLPRPVAPDVAARASRWRLGPGAHPATRASLDRVDN